MTSREQRIKLFDQLIAAHDANDGQRVSETIQEMRRLGPTSDVERLQQLAVELEKVTSPEPERSRPLDLLTTSPVNVNRNAYRLGFADGCREASRRLNTVINRYLIVKTVS